MEKKMTSKTPSRDMSSSAAKPRTPQTPVSTQEAPSKPWSTPPMSRQTSATPMETSVATAAGPKPTPDEIAERAKAIWKAQGCQPGQDVQNWLEAERQLRAERGLS